MKTRARVFIGITAAIGIGFLFQAAVQWRFTDGGRFPWYVAAAVLASTLTVRLPGVSATRWLSSILVIVGILELSYTETMIMACAATLVQNFWVSRRRPQPGETLFNLVNVTATAVGITHWSYWAAARLVMDSGTLMLSIAAAVYFITTTAIPLAKRRMLRRGHQQQQTTPDWYFLTFPYYLVGTAAAGTIELVNGHAAWQIMLLAVPVLYATHRSYRVYLNRLESEKEQVELMAGLHLRTIEALALAIDAKHRTTREHLNRMRAYSVEIAKELGLSDDNVAAVHAAALLHDVGNLAVPEHIMNKPGKLTAEEFEKIKIHPLVGAEILEKVGFPYPVVPIVRAHHERWDGTGYPFGLKGEEIPTGARILAVIDCLHALASERPYQRALPLEEAVERVAKGSGSEFDPQIVGILRKRFREMEALALVEGHSAPASTAENGVCEAVPKDTASGAGGFVASIASARQEAQMLWELTHDLGNSLSLEKTLSLFAIRLGNLVPYDAIEIHVRHKDDFVLAHHHGNESCALPPVYVRQALVDQVVSTGESLMKAVPLGEVEGTAGFVSGLAVPLDGADEVAGVLALYCTADRVFSPDNLRVLLGIQSKLGHCIENAVQFQQAESSATTDYLTDLPNPRSLFLHLDREVARCRRTRSSLAVMVCDLNGFKQVNDMFGHLTGNRILKDFATALRECCREYDYVARMGGDEFVVVAPGMHREAAHERAEVLNRLAVETSERICGRPIVSLSVGTAFFPDHGSDAEELLSEADRRMYSAKQIHHRDAADVAPRPVNELPETTTLAHG